MAENERCSLQLEARGHGVGKTLLPEALEGSPPIPAQLLWFLGSPVPSESLQSHPHCHVAFSSVAVFSFKKDAGPILIQGDLLSRSLITAAKAVIGSPSQAPGDGIQAYTRPMSVKRGLKDSRTLGPRGLSPLPFHSYWISSQSL